MRVKINTASFVITLTKDDLGKLASGYELYETLEVNGSLKTFLIKLGGE